MIKHPYKEIEEHWTWEVIFRGIGDLVENKDLIETTNREYIVGYLCKLIREAEGTKSSL
ncbi:hypothetical protein [Peribacillus deserti]|uniref:hypothetical protein n=1 Tax=Peribacillus deserti TaxID=673318 RepID=UPI0015E13CB1|nr:hypothetical protein [Peribacillus deserti]